MRSLAILRTKLYGPSTIITLRITPLIWQRRRARIPWDNNRKTDNVITTRDLRCIESNIKTGEAKEFPLSACFFMLHIDISLFPLFPLCNLINR